MSRADWIPQEIRDRTGLRVVKKGNLLFRQGDPIKSIYAVETGRIRLSYRSFDGHEALLYVARARDLIIASALFRDSYRCDALATERSSLRVYDRKALLAALAADAGMALRLAKALAEDMSRLRARIELRAIRSARERVLRYLEAHAGPDGNTVSVDGSITELALDLDLTREALHRALARLEKDGLIRRTSDSIRLSQSRWMPRV